MANLGLVDPSRRRKDRSNGRGITWFGYDAPHGTAYIPFYGGAVADAPEAWRSREGIMSNFSYNSAWWAFNLINQYSDLNFGAINKDVREKADQIEAEAFRSTADWEDDVTDLNDEKALEVLTRRSNEFAEMKVAEWWSFAGHLWTKFGRYVVTYNESENGEDANGQAYPEWWLRSPDVGFATWAVDGPWHGEPDSCSISAMALPELNTSGNWHVTFCVAIVSHLLVAGAAYAMGARWKERTGVNTDCYYAQI